MELPCDNSMSREHLMELATDNVQFDSNGGSCDLAIDSKVSGFSMFLASKSGNVKQAVQTLMEEEKRRLKVIASKYM